METKAESKEQQWKLDSISLSLSSSSRSSSITSDSSDGHFDIQAVDIRHFRLPKPSLSASEAQKQRESHQAYNSSVSSYTSSSWSSVHQNHLVDLPCYDPNRIPSSVFSSKPANSTEWSIASNESLFSIHEAGFSISSREDHGLSAALRSGEIQRSEEPVRENPVPLPSVKKTTEPEKETITEKTPDQVEKLDPELDDDEDDQIEEEEEEMVELESDGEHEGEEDMIEAEVSVEIETEKQVVVEDVKENKPEDTNSVVSHSPSVSCRSDASNNSICSFAFPLLQKEDGVNKTPTMEIRGNVSHERSPEYLLPQSPRQPAQPQPLAYSEPQPLAYSEPQRKASKKFESQTQSPKAWRNGWFSCFHCSSKCGFFE